MNQTINITEIDEKMNKIVELFKELPIGFDGALITEELIHLVKDCDDFPKIALAAADRCTNSQRAFIANSLQVMKMIKVQNLVDGFHKIEKDGIWYDILKDDQTFYFIGAEDRNYNKVKLSLNEASEILGVPLKDGEGM